MLTDLEVEKIAKLARIELSPDLQTSLKKDLSAVLDYIALLEEVDTTGVQPLFQVTGLQNQTRPDEVSRPLVPTERIDELLLTPSPSREGRYVKVPSVKSKPND